MRESKIEEGRERERREELDADTEKKVIEQHKKKAK